MSSSLTRAFAASARSYFAAKQSVSQVTNDLLARGPSGLPAFRSDLANAAEQLRHFKNWPYAAIRPIAQRIAGQPIHVGRVSTRKLRASKRHQPAGVEPLEQHELIDLFHDPNDLMVSWSLMFVTVASLELTGRQLWWLPERKQILPIPTSWLRGFEGTTSFTAFKVQPPHSGETFSLPADECVYFAYPDPADPHGAVSPLQAVAGAVDADESITQSQVQMFRRGIHPSHVILVGKSPHPDIPGGVRPHLTGPQQRQIIGAIQKRYSGVMNHGEPAILDGLIEDIKRLSNTPVEMDWLSSGKATKARIAQGFGTNPIIMGEIEGANRASATVADRHFCDYTVNPKIELLSQTMTAWLRPMFGDDLVIWVEPCIAADAEMKLKWAETLAKHSAITGDELRELSPFDLELGDFAEPVYAQGRDPQLDEAMAGMQEALEGMRVFDSTPSRIASRIVKASRANGAPIPR